MTEPCTSLYYALSDRLVWVRITGRANCMVGADFLALVQGLRQNGYHHFSLDLRECALMDSSFLGTLAGLEQELGLQNLSAGVDAITLVAPNTRVTDLIRSLGLDEYFSLTSAGVSFPEQWIPVPPTSARNSSETCSRISYDAHKVIVQLNPANEPRFRDVLDFLKEDLERQKKQKSEGAGEQSV